MSRKLKVHSGAAKRFKRSGTGALRRKRANRSHIRTKMSPKRIRQLRGTSGFARGDVGLVRRMLRF